MADYKDIITGTLNNLVGKVKDVASNGTVRNIYEQGASRAKSYSSIAKLTLEMNGESEELRRVYTEIGKLYFEQAKDAPEGFFISLFSQAEEISRRIAEKEAKIEEMKEELEAQNGKSDIEVDIDIDFDGFEDVVDATENDGANTGDTTPEE